MIKKKADKETRLKVHESVGLMDFLMQKMGGMTRTSVKSLLSHRQVSVRRGKEAAHIETKYDFALQPDDEVVITSGRGKEELVHPKLKVVYEDEDILVVEKKQGLLTVATRPDSTEMTCFSILKNYVRRANPRAGIYVVHRLDRETSGLLVFARNEDCQHYMRDHWRQLVTQRTYVSLVENPFQEDHGTIRTWLTENSKSTKVYSSPVDNGGKMAITHFRVVKQNEQYALLELHLETGRTNQIRVHMQSINHPVVGDRKYGSGRQPCIDRLALHARILEFVHPRTGNKMHFETPVPRDFLKIFH